MDNHSDTTRFIFLFGAFLLAILTPGWAPPAVAVNIRAEVDRRHVAENEAVELAVYADQDPVEVDVSAIEGFRVNSLGTTTNLQIVNSRRSMETVRRYRLFPLHKGTLVIGPLKVTVAGQTIQTEPISIEVTGAKDAPAGSRDAFVSADVSLRRPYEGQQIIYRFRFHYSLNFKNARYEAPEFDGFSAEKVESEKNYQAEFGGKTYRVTELIYVLTPLRTGRLRISPSVLQVDILKPSRSTRRGPFDSFFNDPFFGGGRLESRMFRTDAIEVEVVPLPPTGDADGFSGLVGNFSLTADLDRSRLQVGDSATLTLTIEGSGNIMDAPQPEISFPDAFKAYPDAPETDVRLGSRGQVGQKVFKIALVPTRPGNFRLKPVRIRYFDTELKRYRTLASDAFDIQAAAAERPDRLQRFSSTPDRTAPTVRKEKVEFTGRDILPLKTELEALQSRHGMSPLWFVIWMLVPPAAFFGLKIPLALARRKNHPAARMAREARNELKRAATGDLEDREYLSSLYRAMITAVCSTAGVRKELLTYPEVESLLRRNNSTDAKAHRAAELLQTIEAMKFSGRGLTVGERRELLDDVRKWIRGQSA